MTVDKEELARTMFEALTGDLVFWEDASEAKKEKFRKAVDATLASIEAQDHVIVPVEPTEEEIAQMDDDLQELLKHPPKPGELTSRQIVRRFYKTLLAPLIQSREGGSNG